MKSCILILFLLHLAGCSTTIKERSESLEKRVRAEEVRSLSELHAHVKLLLDSHPELDLVLKREIGVVLDGALDRQQELKDQEARILQLLMTKALNANSLTTEQAIEKKLLKRSLSEIYEKKSENAISAINQISGLVKPMTLKEEFRRDLQNIVRDLR